MFFVFFVLSHSSWPCFSKEQEIPKNVDLEKGINTIDVWWLVDDGGLSLLVPYLMSQHPYV